MLASQFEPQKKKIIPNWTHWGKPTTEAATLEWVTANTAARPAAHSLHLKQFFPDTLFKPNTASNKNQGAMDR